MQQAAYPKNKRAAMGAIDLKHPRPERHPLSQPIRAASSPIGEPSEWL